MKGTTPAMSDSYIAPSNVISRAGAGVVGGLAGGVLLGAILQVLDKMKQMSHLAGSTSTQSGWVLLMVICAVMGLLYGGLLGRWISGQIVSAVGVGVIYGGAFWV